MFDLAWGDGSEAALAQLAACRQAGGAVEIWRGAREPESQRWVCQLEGPRVDVLSVGSGLDGVALKQFEPVGTWGVSRRAPVANFVIRVVTPEAREDILNQLLRQADTGEGALSRPGCVGLTLAAAVGEPEAMLGITHWSSLDDFDAYATWAQSAPWKDVISPVTVDVPLRLLTLRSPD